MRRVKIRGLVRKALKRARSKTPALPSSGGMNSNEARFNLLCLGGKGKYESEKIIITRIKRRKYTPDFVVSVAGRKVVIECKDSYKLRSEDRSRLAWEIAAENDCSRLFVWARHCRTGGYDCEVWGNRGEVRIKGKVFACEDFAEMIGGIYEEQKVK